MGIFQEYLNSKGKITEPVVDVSGDQIDPKTPPNAPPKGGKPYMNSKGGKAESKKGFGDMGDSELEYKPATTKDNKGHAPAKIPTVEQVELANLISDAVGRDPAMLETLVSQLKTNGFMGVLLAEMLQHKESYDHLAKVMCHKDHGHVISENLKRALLKLREEVAAPFQTA
jgi:hypothetical protein